MSTLVSRRDFCLQATAGALALGAAGSAPGAEGWKLNYILSLAMYGTEKLELVLPEAAKCGAEYVDIWPKRHADHREQAEALGVEAFRALLAKHQVKLGVSTRYDLGPFGLQKEMEWVKNLGGKMLVAGAGKGKGDDDRAKVQGFLEAMKPHAAQAEEMGLVIGIENHGNTLLNSVDSLAYFAELNRSPALGVALAPYHLPQDARTWAQVVERLGPSLVFFQGWQHGKGCMQAQPKEDELLQMPGRGSVDFTPALAALKKIKYQGWVEIFMHPFPRGIPIVPGVSAVTDEINRSRAYLDACAAKVPA